MVLYHNQLLCFSVCLHNGTDLLQSQPSFRLDSHPYIYDRIIIMRKVWIYKRKNIKGWWVSWYESDACISCKETNNFLGYYIAHNLELPRINFIYLDNICIFTFFWEKVG